MASLKISLLEEMFESRLLMFGGIARQDSSQTCRKVDIIRHTQLSSQYRLSFKVVTP